MHHQFQELLINAQGISQHIIAIILDIRGFSSFCQQVESPDVGVYISKVYLKIINNYFQFASFYKPTGDGLLVIISYDETNIKERINTTIKTCLRFLKEFSALLTNEPMINYETPDNLGIGLARGSACRIFSGEKILDYSGRILNSASRLMDIARPSGIVFDSSFGYDLLEDNIKELFS